MICNNCGKEIDDNVSICPECGSFLQEPYLNQLLSSGMFMAICILLTVAAALPFFVSGTLELFTILIAIFSWICFAKAKKGNDYSKNLNAISVVLKIQYVLTWVLLSIGEVCLVLGVVFYDKIIFSISNFWNSMNPGFPLVITSNYGRYFLILFMIILAAYLVINGIGRRKLVEFFKELSSNINLKPALPKGLNVWMIVLAVEKISGFYNSTNHGLSSIDKVLASLCSATCYILLYVMINQHFAQEE